MMRSLWTAASGMKTQQSTVDTISNNLANVNTTGYKKERLEFKALLYETIREAGSVENGGSPVNYQIGHGVKAAASVKSFEQGNMESTEVPTDFAIEGEGFFVVRDIDGDEVYTRDGSFKAAVYEGKLMLTSTGGRPVLGSDGEFLLIDDNINTSDLNVDQYGNFSIMKDGEKVDLGLRMQLVQFKNTQGLKSKGEGFFEKTVASGDPINEIDVEQDKASLIIQGRLESSNVQAVEEMVKLIVAQRAYELSSKAIQTSDDMLARANELKR